MRPPLISISPLAATLRQTSMRGAVPVFLRSQNSTRWQALSVSARLCEGLQPPDFLDEKERDIFNKLNQALSPSKLEVQDVSGGCGSMYAIEIASPTFKGLTQLKQHRKVQEILGEDIKKWHGLQLRTKAE